MNLVLVIFLEYLKKKPHCVYAYILFLFSFRSYSPKKGFYWGPFTLKCLEDSIKMFCALVFKIHTTVVFLCLFSIFHFTVNATDTVLESKLESTFKEQKVDATLQSCEKNLSYKVKRRRILISKRIRTHLLTWGLNLYCTNF